MSAYRFAWIYAFWIVFLICFDVAMSYYSEDQCSWRGSGLSQQQGSVEQISLHCSEGTLDWLYPTGALRLTLSPRLPYVAVGPGGSSSGLITACVKPSEQFHGAQLYLERDGVLELLVGDRLGTSAPPRVRCFSRLPGEKVALFLQATPHQDISRKIASFRYELRGDWSAQLSMDSNQVTSEDACRPCNNTEILMAVCTSDFVVRGNIRSVEDDDTLRAAVIKVSATRVFRQKYALFTSGNSRLTSQGEIRTLLQCGVKPGPGSFLFTGRVHFGEAWLGCAPRYKDFQEAYLKAKAAQQIPCELPID
ncbi:meteorin [Periophthalmus magnuspinnatus]|uniref:meteorin n=1 Tax=Periophthalmus magnuspinnatus TaxID=409849 RepID=UPI00145B61A0|nr:meteorin [Periophthalmus magnuspinnatus]